MAKIKMVTWINHHRDYYSAEGFVERGTPFQLPDGDAPPHLSVDEDGKPFINPALAQSAIPQKPKASTKSDFSTMSEAASHAKTPAADRD